MAQRKRRSPEKKGSRRKQSLASRSAAAALSVTVAGASAFGGLVARNVARNPSVAGGTAAFLVVFSFVSANALWYQPGVHPSPFFRTRDLSAPSSVGFRPKVQNTADVTTFRIERPDDAAAAGDAAAPDTTGTPAPADTHTALVMEIQQQLVRRGLYNGNADGVIGPRTSAAILFFEETVGMRQTGEATPELLAALKTDAEGTKTIPAERPPEDVTSPASDADPVAAAILSAEKTIKTAPTPAVARPAAGKPVITKPAVAKPSPAAQAMPVAAKSTDAVADIDRVILIQKGLVNIAYTDVGVDGVVDDRTRAAIRHFQMHYRLPETGEPDAAVLKKLRDIGAL